MPFMFVAELAFQIRMSKTHRSLDFRMEIAMTPNGQNYVSNIVPALPGNETNKRNELKRGARS